MCGRFSISAPFSLLESVFELEAGSDLYVPRYNVAPGQKVPVIASFPERNLELYRWGLIPVWAKDLAVGFKMINARAETLTEKPAFNRPFRKHRCLVLADGFFEWKKEGKTKTPMYIRLKSKEPFAFAGLWDKWKSRDGDIIHSCTIITCPANKLIEPIHERMPVILTMDRYDTWLDSSIRDPDELRPFLVPFDEKLMEAFEVSTVVNSASDDVPECIEPLKKKRGRKPKEK